MADMKSLALMAGVTLVPALAYMLINDLADDPLAWLALVGLGGGTVVIWAAAQSEDEQQKKAFSIIGGVLMLAGLAATVAMDM